MSLAHDEPPRLGFFAFLGKSGSPAIFQRWRHLVARRRVGRVQRVGRSGSRLIVNATLEDAAQYACPPHERASAKRCRGRTAVGNRRQSLPAPQPKRRSMHLAKPSTREVAGTSDQSAVGWATVGLSKPHATPGCCFLTDDRCSRSLVGASTTARGSEPTGSNPARAASSRHRLGTPA